jgi:hypothetical protein
LEEVQSCLRQLVYTPPSNFNGEATGHWEGIVMVMGSEMGMGQWVKI